MPEKIANSRTNERFLAQYTDRFAAWFGGLSEMAQVGVLVGGAIGVMVIIALFAISRHPLIPAAGNPYGRCFASSISMMGMPFRIS
jgi:hypothetical protein